MCDQYGRPLSEILTLPAYDMEWSAICLSIEDDARDPKKRKELFKSMSMAEMDNKDAESRFRAEFD